ncbi:RES domain-containing protein [Gordonia desulfuricans]|uniref:RES domain-containing protein n=1 Tax=Gordonia desulfuricans TaxID=89051 RepID=UPI000B2D7B18|nr:RES domain-containing protein [Gordonia desulfuricans]
MAHPVLRRYSLACYLEVLAFARPSLQLIADLDEIVVDDEDEEHYPTLPPGQVPRSWCEARMLGHGTLTGRFAVPADPDSLATLRTVFRPLAIRYGLDDLDTAALRDGRPRGLTQAISHWIYALTDHGQAAVDGVEFDSRHGDRLRMWALYERAADPDVSPHIDVVDDSPIDAADPQLARALTLLGLEWTRS